MVRSKRAGQIRWRSWRRPPTTSATSSPARLLRARVSPRRGRLGVAAHGGEQVPHVVSGWSRDSRYRVPSEPDVAADPMTLTVSGAIDPRDSVNAALERVLRRKDAHLSCVDACSGAPTSYPRASSSSSAARSRTAALLRPARRAFPMCSRGPLVRHTFSIYHPRTPMAWAGLGCTSPRTALDVIAPHAGLHQVLTTESPRPPTSRTPTCPHGSAPGLPRGRGGSYLLHKLPRLRAASHLGRRCLRQCGEKVPHWSRRRYREPVSPPPGDTAGAPHPARTSASTTPWSYAVESTSPSSSARAASRFPRTTSSMVNPERAFVRRTHLRSMKQVSDYLESLAASSCTGRARHGPSRANPTTRRSLAPPARVVTALRRIYRPVPRPRTQLDAEGN